MILLLCDNVLKMYRLYGYKNIRLDTPWSGAFTWFRREGVVGFLLKGWRVKSGLFERHSFCQKEILCGDAYEKRVRPCVENPELGDGVQKKQMLAPHPQMLHRYSGLCSGGIPRPYKLLLMLAA